VSSIDELLSIPFIIAHIRRLCLVTLDRRYYPARVFGFTEFQIPYALPGSRSKLPVLDGYCDARSNQRALDVRRHVIGTLCTPLVVTRPRTKT
jgi:hypothetical protein